MVKKIPIILLFFLWTNFSKAQQFTNNPDSLRHVLGIEDSIRILKINEYGNSVTFIDFNKKSKFHSNLMLNRGRNLYLEFYNETYKSQLKDQSNFITPKVPENLVHKWFPLYKYEGRFYLYDDCYFQVVLELTDTTFITYWMDGGEPELITDFSNEQSFERVTVSNRSIDFYRTENPNIYILNTERCQYYVPANRIHEFEIIVHHCSDMTDDIIIFEEPDCEN